MTKSPKIIDDQVVSEIRTKLEGWLRRQNISFADAEDIASEAIAVALYEIEKGYASHDYFKFMVYQRARRIAARNSLRFHEVNFEDGEMDEIPDHHIEPEDNLLRDYVEETLFDAISRLPASLRMVIVLISLEYLTQEQAATVLGISVRTVRRRQTEALKILSADIKLRSVLDKVHSKPIL